MDTWDTRTKGMWACHPLCLGPQPLSMETAPSRSKIRRLPSSWEPHQLLLPLALLPPSLTLSQHCLTV